ncbi:MAG: ATP-binding protein [Gammaproteobacteria bacterium]|nr:MAG: ATP-binding protein [Gammaproteobacteria bacterium]
MKKTFNIAGPCHPNKHYMLPTQERCQGLMQLIEQEQYFVIHAARQSGKTTLLLELAQQLNETGNYYALYCSLETVQGISYAEKGIPAIVDQLELNIELHEQLSSYSFAGQANYSKFTTILIKTLSQFCQQLDKPLVILFDEVDCLENGTLIGFLRQLRNGYVNRNRIPFVHSIALVGMRNIRDYKSDIRDDRETLGSYSPFNIVKASKTLRNFTLGEITQLYAQHTEITEQAFSPDVIQKVYDKTQGQPWLVNAIACEIVEQILEFDVSRKILPTQVEQAVQTIILRRDTHIDSLMERLKEKRVKKIVEPLIVGDSQRYDLLDDDYQYVLDLGLLREKGKHIVPSNPIYGEVIIRTLSFRSQKELDEIIVPNYITDGKLDMKYLLSDFQQFWRENSEVWIKRYQYVEAAPHLTLQAFLQRVINHGGFVTREMASGAGRLDLYVHFQGLNYPIELKIRYGEKTYKEGQEQLVNYMNKLDCAEGWLIVFDKRKTVSWDDKIFWQTKSIAQKTVHLVGC